MSLLYPIETDLSRTFLSLVSFFCQSGMDRLATYPILDELIIPNYLSLVKRNFSLIVNIEPTVIRNIMHNLHYLTSINSCIVLIAISIAFPSSVGFTISYLLGI